MFGSGFEQHGHPFERNSRMFKKGDMKYVILDLVKDKPSHGYEITQALEDRFHGLYSPSAGSVYPVLQLLEDMEYVTSNVMDGKKVYTITDKGRKFLEDQKETTEKIKGRLNGWWGADNLEYIKEVRAVMAGWNDIRFQFREMLMHKDANKLAKIKEILNRAHDDIKAVIDER